jgi:basic amino acid/polyamine antiporter, APA family
MAVKEETAAGPREGAEPELKRVMGPKLLLLFVVGDILGTGVYALTGQVAGEVGGAAWLPFIIAFAVATLTACSYLELVTKYPRAAGAALYAHKAFGIHLVTFLVMFTVMCSGITSASAASSAFASNFSVGFGIEGTPALLLVLAVAFMLLMAVVNLRGVAEGVGLNVVLTLVELSGLLMVILIGAFAIFGGQADFSRVVVFESESGKNVVLAVSTATSLAFFAMVGFEDSVNMAEEVRQPHKIFPKVMLTGLGITAVVYVLIAIIAVALVPVGDLKESTTPLVTVVQTAAPGFPIGQLLPFISLFAVGNSALINMMMASRLIYGMSKQGVLPPFLSKVLPGRRTPWAAILFTTIIALGLISFISLDPKNPVVPLLGGTTSLLLLAVFAVVNVAVLVLRRERVDHDHFRTPSALPVIGAIVCVYLVLPWTSGRPIEQYGIAGVLIGIGLVLWAVTFLHRRAKGYGEVSLDTEVIDSIEDGTATRN